MAGILGAVGAVAGLAGSAMSAGGTIAAGRAESRMALERGIAESRQALAMASAESARAWGVARAESSSILASSAAAGVQAIMGAVAETQGVLTQIPLLQMRARQEELAGEVEATGLRMQANEEKAQGSINMLQARRVKELALSKLTARAAASGFTATDPSALRVSDDITKYGAVQEGMELYGGLSRSDALRASAAARSQGAAAQSLATLMEADALRQAGVYTLDAGQFTADLAFRTGDLLANNARAVADVTSRTALNTAKVVSRNAIRTGGLAARGALAGAGLTAGGTILGGISSMARYA